MTKYVITFFERDEQGRRQYRFPEQYYYIPTLDGSIPEIKRGMMPEQVMKMLAWFDDQPLAKALKSYNIGHAFTDICPSSIVINVQADDQEILDEMIFTLQLYSDRDCRFRDYDKATPRRRQGDRRLSEPDRYARAK